MVAAGPRRRLHRVGHHQDRALLRLRARSGVGEPGRVGGRLAGLGGGVHGLVKEEAHQASAMMLRDKTAGGTPYCSQSSTPSRTCARTMSALTSGSSVSWTFSPPAWFSTKKYGRFSLPMSWKYAPTRTSSGSAPTSSAARSA